MIASPRPIAISPADRVEPNAIEAEVSLLFCLLCDGDLMDEVGWLRPEHFYTSQHRLIFEAMQSLWSRNVRPDLLTLANELIQRKTLELVGGKLYLKQLLLAGYTAADWEDHADLVKSAYLSRRMLSASNQIGMLAHAAAQPIEERLDQAQQLVYNIADLQDTQHAMPSPDVCIKVMERLESGKSSALKGVGFDKLFRVTGGIIPGHLHVAIGETNMGKSHFGAAMAMAYAPICPVMVVTVEMDEDEYMSRILARYSGVDSKLILRNELSADELVRVTQAMSQVSALKLHIYAASNPSDTQLRAQIRRMTRYWGEPPKLLVIDYLQYMSRGTHNRVQELDQITREYKEIAVEFGLTSLLLSQARREVMDRKDKRPKKNDSRECGAIENHANLIYGLYRDEVARPEEDDCETGTIEVSVLKNRGGDVAIAKPIKMIFQPALTYFGDCDAY
jgi:replicative DNA helicase